MRFLDAHLLKLAAIGIVVSAISAPPVAGDAILARSALKMGEFEFAREAYEELHEEGSAEASFLLNFIHRSGALGHPDNPEADRYREIAAERGHPQAIVEICVEAGDRVRDSGRFGSVLDACWEGAQQDEYHDFFVPYYNEFTFDMARYYVARALEQSDERGLAFLCYARLWRDIHDDRSDWVRASAATRDAWITIKNKFVLVYPLWAHVDQDAPIDGKTDITQDSFRKWEPCGMSAADVFKFIYDPSFGQLR